MHVAVVLIVNTGWLLLRNKMVTTFLQQLIYYREDRYSSARSTKSLKIQWWLWRGCPPLPFPNREVKTLSADGTAVTRGRVSRRQPFII